MAITVHSLPHTHAVALSVTLDPRDWEGRYTHLEVWRSTLGEGGPYFPLFSLDNQPAPPRVPADGGEPSTELGAWVDVQDKPLEIVVDGRYALTYTSTDPAPIRKATFAAQLQAALSTLNSWVDLRGTLVVSHALNAGSSSSLHVAPSDAATLLGLPTTPSFGKDSRMFIPPGCTRLTVHDQQGQDDYFYRVRFFDQFTQAVGEFSVPIEGKDRVVLGTSSYAKGYVQIMTDGKPTPNMKVSLFYPGPVPLVDGYLLVATNSSKYTDKNGYVEFLIVRDVQASIAIAGTNIVRQVKIPKTGDSFNLLDASLAVDDGLGIVRRDVLYADRRGR